jgi:type I restriction enzyme S subunit
MMREGWRELKIRDVADVVTGSTPASSDGNNWGSGVPFLTPSDMTDAVYSPTAARRLSPQAETRMSRRIVTSPGTAVVCIGATIGKVARITAPTLTNQQINTIVARPEVLDSLYCYYAMQPLRQHLQSIASGSATPLLNKTRFAEVEIAIPPIAVQRRIAGVLGALDDLIDTNKRLADSCAHLRRAIVDQALLEATGSSPLSTFASFVNGKNFTKDASGTGRPIIRTPELRRGPTEGTVWSDAEVEPEYLARRGDILFVWSGSLMVDRWLHQDALVNQHIFKVTPLAGVPEWLVFGLIEFQMPWFLGLAADKATTMGHIQRGHLDEAVPVLASERLTHLDSVVQPLWDQELESSAEAIELARTRDELLPLLLSGAVTVSEVAA